MRIHFFSLIAVTVLAAYYEISRIEWILIIITSGLVISMEAINTAVERTIDYISEERTESAGKIKDISAGAVMIVSVAALVTGLIIFIPKIF